MSEKSSEDISEKGNSIKISSSVLQRLASGENDDEKSTTDDNFWFDKLASIDAEHTKNNGLDIQEVEKLLDNVSKYATRKSDKNCPVDTLRLTDCLKVNKGDSLVCATEVENFVNCIDKLLYEAVRKDLKDKRTSKKETFAEIFEREYQL